MSVYLPHSPPPILSSSFLPSFLPSAGPNPSGLNYESRSESSCSAARLNPEKKNRLHFLTIFYQSQIIRFAFSAWVTGRSNLDLLSRQAKYKRNPVRHACSLTHPHHLVGSRAVRCTGPKGIR
ncbi:hypothetical protein Mapa_008174 [Marchantia paleacea]|nr:hypothetical protein Mapa_008174 [Marchantia paleacea]